MTSTKQTGPRIFPNIYTHVLTESLKRRCWSYCSVFSRRQFLCTILRSLPKTKPFWWPENWKKRPSQALRQILNLNSPPARTWIALAFKRNSGGLAGLNAGTELLFLLLQKINMNYMNIYMYIYIYLYLSALNKYMRHTTWCHEILWHFDTTLCHSKRILKPSAESHCSLQQGSNAEVIQASSQIWRYVARWLSFHVSEQAVGKESRLHSEVGWVPLFEEAYPCVSHKSSHSPGLAHSQNRYPHRGARSALIPPSGAVTALLVLWHSPSWQETWEMKHKTLLERLLCTPGLQTRTSLAWPTLARELVFTTGVCVQRRTHT